MNLGAQVCASSNAEPDVISPPENFSMVEAGLYRSGIPSVKNFAYIRSLQLRSVILLSAERAVRSIRKFFEDKHIMVRHVGMRGADDGSWRPVAEEVVKEALELMLCAANYPLLVCDVGGVHVVGMVIGCLRRLQRWNLTAAVAEYRMVAGAKKRYVNEQFIELFDVDLVTVPEHVPEWFAHERLVYEQEVEEYRRLLRDREVDGTGTMVVGKEDAPSYRVYYYSCSSPLNSRIGGARPRVERM